MGNFNLSISLAWNRGKKGVAWKEEVGMGGLKLINKCENEGR